MRPSLLPGVTSTMRLRDAVEAQLSQAVVRSWCGAAAEKGSPLAGTLEWFTVPS
jgi:hypothetical protein